MSNEKHTQSTNSFESAANFDATISALLKSVPLTNEIIDQIDKLVSIKERLMALQSVQEPIAVPDTNAQEPSTKEASSAEVKEKTHSGKATQAEKSNWNKLTSEEKIAYNYKAQKLGIKPKEYLELELSGNLPKESPQSTVKNIIPQGVKSEWNALEGNVKTLFHTVASNLNLDIKGKEYFLSLTDKERQSIINNGGVNYQPAQVQVISTIPIAQNVLQSNITVCKDNEVANDIDTEAIDVKHEDLGEVDKTKKARKNAKDRQVKAAKKAGLTIELYLAKIEAEKDHKMARKQIKLSLDEETKEINKTSLSNIKLPEYVKVTKFDSDEWKALIEGENGSAYKSAQTNVGTLIHGETDEKRLNTFISENGVKMSQEEIIRKVSDLITSDCMKPIEEKFRHKVGNFCAAPFYKWYDKVIASWKPANWEPNAKFLGKAKRWLTNELFDLVVDTFGTEVINPISIEDALEKVTKGRNSGYPFFTNKWFQNPEMVEHYTHQAQEILDGYQLVEPRILYKRVQSNGDNPKMRAVICPPKSEAIAAKCFTTSFVQMFKNSTQFSGFLGGTNVHHIAYDLLEKYDTLVSSDFSSFDATCQQIMVEVFDILKALTPIEYNEYFDNLLYYYQYSELITPIGMISGNGVINGMNSGDGWTSVIGTLCNALANKYTMLQMNINAEVLSFGDDCVVATNDPFDPELYAKHMFELGMICNPSKQEVTSGDDAYFSFLGYYYFKKHLYVGKEFSHMLPIFPINRALSSLIYCEKFAKLSELAETCGLTKEERAELELVNKRGIDMLGHLMKLENLKNHPNYVSFCKLFCETEANKMSSDLILPFEKVMDGFAHLRIVKDKGIETLATLRLLYNFEYKKYTHNMVQMKPVYSEYLFGSLSEQISRLA